MILTNRQLSRSTDDLNLSPSASSSNVNPAECISESLNVIARGAEEDAAIVAQVHWWFSSFNKIGETTRIRVS